MKNKRIGIDFDGVYTNTGDLIRQVIKSKYGMNIPPACLYQNVSGYEIIKSEFEKTIKDVCENDKYLLILKEQPNATDIIKQISKYNDVRFITSREGKEFLFAQKYLDKKGLLHLLEKNPARKDKNELAKGLDIFVEDMPERAISLMDVVPRVILFNTYDNLEINLSNQEKERLKKIERINNWNQFLSL